MSLTAVGFWLVYVCGVGAAFLAPLAGVLLYVLVYHINPNEQWWGATVRAIGLRTSLTVMIAIAIGLVLRYSPYRGRGRQFPLPIVLAFALTALALASMTWGYGLSPRGVELAEKIIKVMIFVLILIRCVREPYQYHLVIIAWLAGVFYIGYQAFGNVGVYQNGRLARGLGGPDFAESSSLAVHLIATLPLIGAMFFMARRWWTRGLLLITGALAVNTIIMTRTRNAVAGLIAMAVVAALSLPRGYRRKGWLAIGLGSVLALQLVDSGWWARMATIRSYRLDESAMGRLTFWHASIEIANDHPFGIGLGNFHSVVKEYVPGLSIVRSAHNTILECLADLGYPGLTLFLMVLALTFWRLSRMRREANQIDADLRMSVGNWQMRFHLGWHAMALRAGLAGYLACGMFTTRLWSEDFWILIGLAACLFNVRANLLDRARESSLLFACSADPRRPQTHAIPAVQRSRSPGLRQPLPTADSPALGGSSGTAAVARAGATTSFSEPDPRSPDPLHLPNGPGTDRRTGARSEALARAAPGHFGVPQAAANSTTDPPEIAKNLDDLDDEDAAFVDLLMSYGKHVLYDEHRSGSYSRDDHDQNSTHPRYP